MKDYLNKDETNDFMIMGMVLDAAEKALGISFVDHEHSYRKVDTVRKSWLERGNITKEEHKNLKSAQTFLNKFWLSVFSRLSKSEQDTLRKKLSKFTFRIMDEYTMKRIYGELYKDMESVKLDRETFYTWCENLASGNCKGCTKHYESCELHRIFDENLIPESDWALENCRYAYKDE